MSAVCAGNRIGTESALQVTIDFILAKSPISATSAESRLGKNPGFFYHGRVHKEERPFWCGECGKCFIQNCNLVKHQKVHSMPLVCNECGSVFTPNYNLIRHKRVHLMRKQYECKECGKVYCNSSGLCKHRQIHGVSSAGRPLVI